MKTWTGISGIKETVQFMGKQRKVAKEIVASGLSLAAETMYAEIIKNASKEKDQTNKTLKRLGSPFAKKHGSSQAHLLGPEWAKKPWMIHKGTSGNVVNSIKYKFKRVSGEQLAVFYYDYKAVHAKYVIKGTKIMFGRDVIMGTLHYNEKKIKRKFVKHFVKAWNKSTRVYRKAYDAHKRFRGGATSV
jgi:catalase (peroxidase I)